MIKSLRLRMVKALIPCFSLLLLASLFSEINAQSVTGKVFRDFDASGQQTTALPALIEPGVPGVTVKAFNAAGTQIGAAVQTALNGTYSLPVATSNQVRIEFSNFPAAFFSGPKGALSGTSVQFVNGGSTANLGINYPSDYCGVTDPKLVTPCYVNGTPLNGGNSANDPFIVTIPYTPTLDGVVTATSENGYLSKGSEVGATWGMAYQRSSKFIFTSALLKRHSGFGTGGPGAIYKIDVSGGTQITSLFVDLNTDLSVSAGTDPRNPLSGADSLSKFKTAPNRDSTAFGLVGKMSLGDIDISDDEKTLWVINTFDRKLYELPIGSPATKPTTKIAHTLPDPGCIKGVFRPWATKFWRGKIYVGGVCTAENGGDSTNLRAYIYSFTPGDVNPNNFNEEFSLPLNYPRGFTSVSSGTDKTSAAWRPWVAKWSDIKSPLPGAATYSQTIHPQPILSDIEFDVDGSMILGFMDRAGHQLGNNNYSPNPNDTQTYEGASSGDLLRAGMNINGTFTLESNATVNGVVSGGANQTPPQGPNGGEFYWQDMYGKSINKNYPDGAIGGGGHQEISLGGIALFPGKNEVVETVFDPLGAFRAGGVRWFDNTTGASPRAYQIFGTDAGGSTFGKANGLGDLELLCANQPIEVGNRLWNDIDKDGIQDANEPALTGVTVQLFKNGVQIGSDILTDATTGEFYFTGLIPNSSDYDIRIPNVKGASKQAKLAGFDISTANVGANGSDLIDSDASVSGTNTYASIPFSTGNAGENLHALDAGFSCVPPVAKPTGITGDIKICDPLSVYKLPDAKTGVDAESWTVVASPPNSTPTINAQGFLGGMTANGKYTFVLTNNNTGCTDTVSIVRSAIAMAGGDKSICSPATTSSVSAAVNGQVWSVVSQPAGANAVIAANGNISAMSKDGVYTFRITEGACFDETT
jgi:trimeric autotransporter adhesin